MPSAPVRQERHVMDDVFVRARSFSALSHQNIFLPHSDSHIAFLLTPHGPRRTPGQQADEHDPVHQKCRRNATNRRAADPHRRQHRTNSTTITPNFAASPPQGGSTEVRSRTRRAAEDRAAAIARLPAVALTPPPSSADIAASGRPSTAHTRPLSRSRPPDPARRRRPAAAPGADRSPTPYICVLPEGGPSDFRRAVSDGAGGLHYFDRSVT